MGHKCRPPKNLFAWLVGATWLVGDEWLCECSKLYVLTEEGWKLKNG